MPFDLSAARHVDADYAPGVARAGWYSRSIGSMVMAIVLSGCASGFSRDEAVDAFVQAHPDVSPVDAGCVVDQLIVAYEAGPVNEDDLEALERQLIADPVDQDFVLDQFRAMFGCGLTGEVELQLTGELRDDGLEPEPAACVAAAMAESMTVEDLEVLIADDLTPEFYETFFSASEACGALPG